MRETFSTCLVKQVNLNPLTYVLSGDHGYALFDALRKEKPSHFINCGVAEQNMVGVAAGLSKIGMYPIVYGLSAFIPLRVVEQIKIDFCYEGLPGLFIGDGAGLVYSHLGTSHQSTEDIACLRAIPNIQIFSPADEFELEFCFNKAVLERKTVYLRLGKADLGSIHKTKLKDSDFLWEKGPLLTHSKNDAKLAFFATGSMVKTAQTLVEKMNLVADVYSVSFIKPFDENLYANLLKKYENIVTFEEHSIFGGLGDCLASVVANLGNTQIKKIGISDRFSNKCGTYDYLMKEHGLDLESVAHKVL